MGPSFPWSRIIRVEATFSDNLNKVVIKSMEGNADNSNGFEIYMPTRRIIKENVMLNDKRISSNMAGRGIIITTRITTADIAIRISLFFAMKEISEYSV